MSIMTTMGKKGLSGVAQDFVADGSPSFADLVCTQNQNAKLQTQQFLPLALTNKATGVQNMEPEFEFPSTTDDSTKANPNSNAPAKVLFHKGRVLSQSVLSKSSQPQALEETSLKETQIRSMVLQANGLVGKFSRHLQNHAEHVMQANQLI